MEQLFFLPLFPLQLPQVSHEHPIILCFSSHILFQRWFSYLSGRKTELTHFAVLADLFLLVFILLLVFQPFFTKSQSEKFICDTFCVILEVISTDFIWNRCSYGLQNCSCLWVFYEFNIDYQLILSCYTCSWYIFIHTKDPNGNKQ